MNINDQYILDYFFINNKINNNKIKHYNNIDNKTNLNIYNYLLNRFKDNLENTSISEILNRIKYKIEIRPICLTCGKPVVYNGNIHKGLYNKYCCTKCSNSNLEKIKKEKITKFERYGDENYININKARQTCLNKYGKPYYTNREKNKETCLEKYNIENISQLESVKNKKKQTYLKKYGVDNPSKLDKIKKQKEETCLNNFGVKYGFQTQKSIENSRKTHLIYKYEIREKQKQTNLIKYGNENYHNIEQMKQTNLKKYGVDCIFKLPYFREKIISTNIQKYYARNWVQSLIGKYTLSIILSKKNIQNKIYQTKKKNNSFNKSNPENESYILLKEKYPDIQKQYKSKIYPFNCDFYIPSIDLYIECHYHWTHGGHLYNENNKDDIETLNKWKDKNTKYYNNAIKTWTYYDIEKNKIAKENNLNYIIFWNINKLKEWVNNLNE